MTRTKRITTLLGSAMVFAAAWSFTTFSASAEDKKVDPVIAEGKEIAFNTIKGNCLACHAMQDGEMSGTIAPPLIAMKLRFPDKAVLRAQVVDPRMKNPSSIMPPFGAHEILTDEEIDKVIEYIYTL